MKSPVTRGLLWGGTVAGPLFTAAFLIEGATRADYDPLRHPVSSLALGPSGWTQDLNFIVAGLLTLGFAVALRKLLRPGPPTPDALEAGTRSTRDEPVPAGGTLVLERPSARAPEPLPASRTGLRRGATWGPILIGVWAVQLILAGIFVTDPVSGYPPGTPDRLTEYVTTHGAVHDLVSIPGFIALAAAFLVFAVRFAAQRSRGWAAYSVITFAVFAVAFYLSSRGFDQSPGLVKFGGLFQRLAVTTGWLWLTLLATRHLSPTAAPTNEPASTTAR
ncbi:DUF998 domain-containing protein [Sphaerisporangium dianthi]|uniref:DUF998 domain-containing protein n=1 Tax=Sphaerisporangium dianthi TaxID=1436120 RepID=A0ABV9CFV6_9ACTN